MVVNVYEWGMCTWRCAFDVIISSSLFDVIELYVCVRTYMYIPTQTDNAYQTSAPHPNMVQLRHSN